MPLIASHWLVWTSARRWGQVAARASQTDHGADPGTLQRTAFFIYLASPLRSFDVGCEDKINLSRCGRHTIDCVIPPIQNTQIDRAEVVRCTLLVSCSTDLDYCVVFVDRVGVFLEHVHRTFKSFWTVYAKLSRRFLLFRLPFGSRSKHHSRCSIRLKSESTMGQPASNSVVMTKIPGRSRTVAFVRRTKMFANTINFERNSQTTFTKAVRISKIGCGECFAHELVS